MILSTDSSVCIKYANRITVYRVIYSLDFNAVNTGLYAVKEILVLEKDKMTPFGQSAILKL